MIKDFFDKAWTDLKLIYDEGSICSERHMQCELFKLLTNQANFNNDYRIFVEPRITDLQFKSVIPDFIIISKSSKKIVAAVELKYIPFSHPKYQKDLETLIGFYNGFKEFPSLEYPLLTNPETGLYTADKFGFAEDLILIYCIIAKVDSWIIANHKESWKRDDDSTHGPIKYLQYVGAIPAYNDADWKPMNSVPPSGG